MQTPVAQGHTFHSETASTQKRPQAQTLPTGKYGAASVVGERLESCETTSTWPNARVLTANGSWQSTLKQAKPGTVFLLRAGLYQTSSPLKIGAGQLNRPVLVKPYNCEAVTLRGGLMLFAHTTVAGMRIEGALPTQSGPSYVIRADGRTQALQTIIIRNNTIVGGEIDAIRLNDNLVDVKITGNQIDGGKAGHDLFVTTEAKPVVITKSPDKILVSNNRFTKVYFRTTGIASEDMFQVRSVREIQFLSNSCENGSRMEQCIDIKDASVAAVIRGNFFNGTTLHQDGAGEDGSTGCMVIHEFDGHPEAHLIENNYFKNCRTTIIRFASEGGAANSRGTVRYNVFLNPDVTDNDGLLIWRSEDVVFESNTMIRGALKLGRSNGLTLNPPIVPKNTVLKNNLFYLTRIDDNTSPPLFAYLCSYSLFFQLSQRGNRTLQCTTSLTSDPKLTLLANEDYRPAASSPACRGGENSTTLGALPCQPAAVSMAAAATTDEVVTWYDTVTNAGDVALGMAVDPIYDTPVLEIEGIDEEPLPEAIIDAVDTLITTATTLPLTGVDNTTSDDSNEASSSSLVYRNYLPLVNR